MKNSEKDELRELWELVDKRERDHATNGVDPNISNRDRLEAEHRLDEATTILDLIDTLIKARGKG